MHNIDKKSTGAVVNTWSNLEAGRRNSNNVNDYSEVMCKKLQSLTSEEVYVNSSCKLNKTFGIWRGPSCETNYIDLDYMKDEFDEMFNDPELQQSSEKKSMKTQKIKHPNDLRERLQNGDINGRCTIEERKKSHHTDNEKNGIQKSTLSKSNMEIQQNAMSFSSGNGPFRRRWYNNRNARRRNKDGCGNQGRNYMINEIQNMNCNKNRNGGSGSGAYNGNSLPINNNGRIHRFHQRSNEDNVKYVNFTFIKGQFFSGC